jgi:hypothetical protein
LALICAACGQCYKTFYGRNYVAGGVFPYDLYRGYAESNVIMAVKSFITLAPVANVIKLFTTVITSLVAYFPMIYTEVTLKAT